MLRIYNIRCIHTLKTAKGVHPDHIRDILNSWFHDAPANVHTMIDGLVTTIERGDYYGDHAVGLGLEITPA